MTDQSKSIQVSNYDRIKAMAKRPETIARFVEIMGSKPEAMGYITSAMLAVANNPDLQDCTPSSLFNSVMRAASLRLYCDPALRQAHLVPFKNRRQNVVNATLILGYIGINNLALRTGQYEIANAGRLYEGQTMETDQLTGISTIQGKPISKTVTAYFHYFKLKTGYSHVLFMTVEELHAHGERYGRGNEMWTNRFDDMSMKTVTRLNLLKYGILDPHDKTVVAQLEDERDPDAEPIQVSIIDGEFSDADDDAAALAAVEIATQKANAPKKTEAEIMGELGFEKPQKPTSTFPVHKEETHASGDLLSQTGYQENNPNSKPRDQKADDAEEPGSRKPHAVMDPKDNPANIANMSLEVAKAIPYSGNHDKPLDELSDNQLMDLVTTEKDKKAANQKYNPIILQAAGVILTHRLEQ
jgi:recombination protein RecT